MGDYEPKQLQRLQGVLLTILKDIDRVCRSNGITYFLDSGTVLGAVRHGGFIPWDDDVDIGMLRDDYERFLRVAPEALGERYAVVHPGVDERLAGLFAKVWLHDTVFATQETIDAGLPQGIFVDVFPYDALSADRSVAQRQKRACRNWQNASYLYYSRAITVPHAGVLGMAEKAACAAAHLAVRATMTPAKIRASFDKAALAGAENPSDLCLCMCYAQMDPMPRNVLVPPAPIVFEGVELMGPAKPVEYLERMYGATWCELPPEERRRNHAPVKLDFGSEEG